MDLENIEPSAWYIVGAHLRQPASLSPTPSLPIPHGHSRWWVKAWTTNLVPVRSCSLPAARYWAGQVHYPLNFSLLLCESWFVDSMLSKGPFNSNILILSYKIWQNCFFLEAHTFAMFTHRNQNIKQRVQIAQRRNARGCSKGPPSA